MGDSLIVVIQKKLPGFGDWEMTMPGKTHSPLIPAETGLWDSFILDLAQKNADSFVSFDASFYPLPVIFANLKKTRPANQESV